MLGYGLTVALTPRWDLNQDGDDCLVHSLHGHAKRSFSVLWSPLLPQRLLSGSDDATARVWDTDTGACVALLEGHRTEVRALCWHPELPWLVLTGGLLLFTAPDF